MSKYSKFFVILILICALEYKLFLDTIKNILIRNDQLAPCEQWCDSKGLLVTFNETEKQHCKQKCLKFTYIPPLVNFLCRSACKPVDFFVNGLCIKSEFCEYFIEVNKLNVKDAVKTRWLQALTKKVVNKVAGG